MRRAVDTDDPRIVHMSFDNVRTECGKDAGPKPGPSHPLTVTCDICRVHSQAHAAKLDAVIRKRRQA